MVRDSRKRIWIGIGGATAVCVVLVLVAALPGKARVEGTTSAERVASVCRIADARPAGAARAIAEAAVGDPDASVRRASVLCLGKFARSADRAAVDTASRDADDTVRAAAALTLARRGGEDDAERLKEMVCDDSSETVRAAAADGLALDGSPVAVVALLEVMESGPTPEIRLTAGTALTKKYGVVTTLDPNDSDLWGNAV